MLTKGHRAMHENSRLFLPVERQRFASAFAIVASGVIVLAACGGGASEVSAPVIRGAAANCAPLVGAWEVTAAVGGKARVVTYKAPENPATWSTFTAKVVNGTKSASINSASSSGSITVTGLEKGANDSFTVTGTDSAGCSYTSPKSGTTTTATTTVPNADASQATLTVANTTLTGTAGTAITLTASGGSGGGAVTYAVTGAGCSVTGTSLSMTAAGTCSVTATKAASTGFLVATSAPVSFTFSTGQGTLRAQQKLTVTHNTATGTAGTPIKLKTSGGSGTGAVTFALLGTGCTLDGDLLNRATPDTCNVTATKAASGDYSQATSAVKTFNFTAASQETLTVANTTLTGTAGTAITLTASGGSGDGAVSFAVTGTVCAVSGTSLNATAAGTCSVTATKAASGAYSRATSASKDFTFTGGAKPGSPTVTKVEVSGTTATVTFTAPASNGAPAVTSYTATSNPQSKTGTANGAGSGTIQVTNLERGVAYTFTVTALNSAGASLPSGTSASVTVPALVPSAPGVSNPWYNQNNKSLMYVTVSAPESIGAVLIEYEAYLQGNGNSYKVTAAASGGNQAITFSGVACTSGLSRGYSVSARARNSAGWGPWGSSANYVANMC